MKGLCAGSICATCCVCGSSQLLALFPKMLRDEEREWVNLPGAPLLLLLPMPVISRGASSGVVACDGVSKDGDVYVSSALTDAEWDDQPEL